MNAPRRSGSRLGPRAGTALVLLLSAGLQAGEPTRSRATMPPPLTLESPAPGIHVHRGTQAETSPANGGDIANIGFIVGGRCVAVIDTGGTRAIGAALLAAIRRTTDKPVCAVINTHVHPDHSYGDSAFVDADPGLQFIAHAEFAPALAARREHFRAGLERTLGTAAAGSEIAVPTRTISGEQTLDLGDRLLRLKAWPTAHTNHDLTVFDEQTGTLWTGDLLFIERIPVVDGKVLGWLAAIDALLALKPARVVPGHGPLDRSPAAAFGAERDYLQALVTSCRAALRDGVSLVDAVRTVGRSGMDSWLLADQYHARNITTVYTELEWED